VTAEIFSLRDEADLTGWPLWLQAEQAILRAIRSDRLRPGEQLPGEHQLAEALGIHRHTVRRAIESLAAKGLLEIRRGRGTFVAPRPIAYRVGGRSRFTDNILAAGLTPSTKVLRARTEPASDDQAANLALGPGAQVVALELLRMGDGVPILIATHYMPAELFPDFAERFATIQSITKTFASYGVVGYRRGVTRLDARQPTSQEAAELGQSRAAPVLVWESVNVAPDGRPINYDCSVFAASRVSIVVDES
jgi:GntR family phosphonate transport system transcriptional regulator